MPIGPIFTASEASKQLREANRGYNNRKTFEELYGKIGLQEQQAVSNLNYDYSKAMSEAYASSLKQNAAIAGSNLGQGFKANAIADTDAMLEQAYQNYKENYYKNLQSVEETYNTARNQVTTALDTRGEFMARAGNSPYQYLQYLYDNYSSQGDDNPYKNFMSDYIYTDEESGESRLKRWDEISNELGLFDNEGNVTDKGSLFYDKIMNTFDTELPETYYSWLSENDEELYNWLSSNDYFDYNPYIDEVTGEEKNTNIGSFRTYVGMDAGDPLYTFTDKVKNETFDKIVKDVDNFVNNIEYSDNQKENAEKMKELITKYQKELNISDDDLLNVVNKYLGGTKSTPAEYIFHLLHPLARVGQGLHNILFNSSDKKDNSSKLKNSVGTIDELYDAFSNIKGFNANRYKQATHFLMKALLEAKK